MAMLPHRLWDKMARLWGYGASACSRVCGGLCVRASEGACGARGCFIRPGLPIDSMIRPAGACGARGAQAGVAVSFDPLPDQGGREGGI